MKNPVPARPYQRRRWFTSASRLAVQIGFFAFLAYVAVRHQVVGGGPTGSPSVEAFCPLGGLETFFQLLTTGQLLNRLFPSTMVVFVALVALTILAGPSFCGWICPFGALQEWVGKLGKRVFGKRFSLPANVDKVLQYGRFVMLAWLVIGSAVYGTLVFRDYDPYIALAHITVFEITTGTFVLGLVLVASLFVERPWCRYLCPLGGFVGLAGRFSLLRVRRDASVCRDCGVCDKACPMNLKVATASTPSTLCTSCLNCVAACPHAGALSVRTVSLRLPARPATQEVASDAR